MSYQKHFAVGYLGQDARVNEHEGRYVVIFSMGFSETWIDRETGEKIETEPLWISYNYWRNEDPSELAKYLKKGAQVTVIGKMQPGRIFTDKEGKHKCGLSVKVSELHLMKSAKKDEGRD